MSDTATLEPATEQATKSPPPVERIRVGRVSASVWARPQEDGSTFYGVSFERRYCDSKGQWHSTHSYGELDLLALAKAADLAHARILALQQGTGS